MTRKQAMGLLKIASEAVPSGIYALEFIGKGYIEMRNDPMTKKAVKLAIKDYGKKGVKVYANY